MSVRTTTGPNYLLLSTDSPNLSDDEAKALISQLKARPERLPAVIFDFSGIQEVSLTALRTLTLVLSVVSQRNAHLAIIGNTKVTNTIAEQSLDRFFPCYGSLEEALKALVGEESRQKTMEFLNATLEAVTFTLQTTINTKVSAGEPFTRDDKTTNDLEIGAVVGLVSTAFTGSLILGFRRETYLKLMSRLFGQEFTEITPDIQDGAAEILNIVLGHVKTTLNEKGYGLKQAIPSVVRGTNIKIMPTTNQPSMIVPYTSDVGTFYVELTTSTRKELNI